MIESMAPGLGLILPGGLLGTTGRDGGSLSRVSGESRGGETEKGAAECDDRCA